MNGEACIICEEPIEGPPFGPLYAPQCQACWLAVAINSPGDLEYLRKAQDLYPAQARDRDELKDILDNAGEWEEEEDGEEEED